jgi:hypothetical protein
MKKLDPAKAYMRLIKDGTAVEILFNGPAAEEAKKHPNGVYAEWLDDHVVLREAQDGEPRTRVRKYGNHYRVRINLPPHVRVKKPTLH